MENELPLELRFARAYIELQADRDEILGKLWLTDPEKYGTTKEEAERWIREAKGLKRAVNIIDGLLT